MVMTLSPSQPDAVAGLDLIKCRGIFDAEYHSHSRHAEIFQGAMLDGELAGGLVDLSKSGHRLDAGARS